MGQELWAALLVACIAVTPAKAQSFTLASGAQGQWGHPYGWLGPRGTHLWEEYRKDAFPGGYPAVTATDLGGGQVLFNDAREQGSTVNGVDQSLSITPGVFVGANRALQSPGTAVLSLSPLSNDYYDIRLGFFEDQAPGGGAALSTFIAHQGGDNGATQDPFFGNWGVDGLFINFQLFSNGSTWKVQNLGVTLKAAGSQTLQQPTSPGAITLDPPAVSLGPGAYSLPLASNQPLSMAWSLRQDATGTTFDAALGGVAVHWPIDDGVSLHGLSDPAATDGVGYQGGSLDVASLVPHWFLGIGGEADGVPPEAVPITLLLSGSVPVLQLPSHAKLNQPLSVQVTALDAAGAQDVVYARTVQFSSSDTSATLPAPYTFQPADRGSHVFSVKFGTEGSHSLTVRDRETPALQSTVTGEQIHGLYTVGCGFVPGVPWALLSGLLLKRRRRAQLTPAGATGDAAGSGTR